MTIYAPKSDEMVVYSPKGSMCIACIHCPRDCSHLPFRTMQPIGKYGSAIIVRCTDFARDEKKGGAT